MFDRYNRPIHVIRVDETTTTIKHSLSDVATGITPAAPTVTVLLAAGKKDWFDLASASD